MDDSAVSPTIIPQIWYPEPDAAIAFLERAFDFHRHSEAPGEDGDVRRIVQVGKGFVFVGSARTPRFVFRTPRESSGVNTGAIYIAAANVDALYKRAKKGGATIVRKLADTDYGSREFSVYDPDEYLWNFGTYNPTVGRSNHGTASSDEVNVFEALRYERPRTAMEWLVEAFGFEQHTVVAAGGEDVRHALLRFGSSLLMIGGTRTGDPLKIMPPQQASPPHLGGIHTQVVHVVVDDPDKHCMRAAEKGAAILEPPANVPSGARRYIARDPEGYVWRFSNFSPAAEKRIERTESTRERQAG